jgi:hypothetical protein
MNPVKERQGEGRPTLPSGVYRHPESGQELVAVETSKFGNPMADAFTRMGFEFIGPLSSKALASDADGEPGKLPNIGDPFGQGPAHNVGTTDTRSAGELEAALQAAKAREADSRKAAQKSHLVDDSKALKLEQPSNETVTEKVEIVKGGKK